MWVVLCWGARVSITPEPSADLAYSRLSIKRKEPIPPVSMTYSNKYQSYRYLSSIYCKKSNVLELQGKQS